MKNRFRHRAVSMLLAAMMAAAPIGGTVFASEGITPEQPDRPVAESYEDNDKIEEYNRKVDEYNEAAKSHNETVDKEYAAAVEETNRRNAEIDQHNEAEEQRVREAEERNAEAQRAADEANAAIDAENLENERLVNEHNALEDEKVQASENARNEALAANDAAAAHNAEVDQYLADLDQYEKDLAKYKKDLSYEQQILNLGYASVDAYNQMIINKYNKPAEASVEKNRNAKAVSVSDLYTVEEAAEKSGRKVKVHIEHNFIDVGMTLSEDFEIDENDVLIAKSAGSAGNATQPGWANFYFNTDDAHTKGYWMPVGDMMMDTANYKNYSWDCGSVHEVSYKDGKRHANDNTDIDIIFDYMWNALRTYKTYDTPVDPTAPTAPESLEKMDMTEVPDLYTAEYKVFEKKENIKAILEDIEAANILEKLEGPEKGEYIALLSYMTLFDVPEAVIPAVAAAATEMIPAAPATKEDKGTPAAPKNRPAAPAARTADNQAAAEIVEQGTPMAAPEAFIADSDAPLAANNTWALLNLIMTVITGIISAVLLTGYFGKKEDEEDENEDAETKRKGLVRLASLIPAAGAIIAFILTEDMTNMMAITDRWTILMAVILLIQAVTAILAKKEKEESEETAETI